MSAAAPRLRVDPDVCAASGTCVFLAPRTFAIDEDAGVAHVVDQAGDPLEDVRDAVDACPTGAIALDESGGESGSG